MQETLSKTATTRERQFSPCKECQCALLSWCCTTFMTPGSWHSQTPLVLLITLYNYTLIIPKVYFINQYLEPAWVKVLVDIIKELKIYQTHLFWQFFGLTTAKWEAFKTEAAALCCTERSGKGGKGENTSKTHWSRESRLPSHIWCCPTSTASEQKGLGFGQ